MLVLKFESVYFVRFLRWFSIEKRRRGMNIDNVNVCVILEFNKLLDCRKVFFFFFYIFVFNGYMFFIFCMLFIVFYLGYIKLLFLL